MLEMSLKNRNESSRGHPYLGFTILGGTNPQILQPKR